MIYRTFALAFIFALAFGSSDVTAQNDEIYYDAVSEVNEPEAQEGMWSKCKGAACNVKERLQRYAKSIDAIHNRDQEQGATIKLVKELVKKIQKLLSESQKTKSCPATAEKAAEDFQTQLGALTNKYLDPLMKKMDEAMEKLPKEVKALFKDIMEDFKFQIQNLEKPMQELTQEDLQQLLMGLKEKYELKVKETMEEANKRFDADAPEDKETKEQKENLEKLQNLMKRFEGKTQGEAFGMVTDPEFVEGVEGVLGQDVMRQGLVKATEAIDDITHFTTAAQCAAKMGLFDGDMREL